VRTSRESALLLALLFKRSEKTRVRLSTVTVKKLSKREHLRAAFIEELIVQLNDLGLVLIELERGGFGIIPVSALNGAPPVTAKKYLMQDLKRLREGKLTFDDILNELDIEIEADNDDDY
jgi:hypothetical protein